MTFLVYHAQYDDAERMAFDANEAKEFNSKNYELVAEVFADDLDHAYFLTNSIDDYWGSNKKVIERGDEFHRSTSIGDIIMDTSGDLWIVDVVGFKKYNDVFNKVSM